MSPGQFCLTQKIPSGVPSIMLVSVFLESEDLRITWERGSINQNLQGRQVREHTLLTQQLTAQTLKKKDLFFKKTNVFSALMMKVSFSPEAQGTRGAGTR